MAAELFGLVLGFDYTYVVCELIEDITGRRFAIEALVDSKTAFGVVAKQSQTSERPLQIDALALRESYDNCDFENMGWIPGERNAANPLTKLKISLLSPLFLILTTNKFTCKLCGWAEIAQEKKSPRVSIK